MTVLDGSTLLTLTKWSDDGHYLREFLGKFQLPQVARIIKGQYLTVGASLSASSSSSSSSSTSLSQAVFLCSKGKRLKVAAQCVKFKEDGRKVVSVGPKLAIPDNYDGWFEILSEEGRAVRCIESVAELARRFPDSCLVREAIKAYVARGDDMETITDKVRTIAAGETLVLVSEVLGTSANQQSTISPTTTSGTTIMTTDKVIPGRFLRCFDVRGENVYLGFEQRGKFSIVAKEDNISGVHSIKNLMNTKRFPMMVRLVSGKAPVSTCGSTKIGANFIPELRLLATFEEECVMAMSLQKDQPVVAIPLTAPLKIQAAKNTDVLCKTTEFARLDDKCKSVGVIVDDVHDKIQIIVAQSPVTPAVKKLPYFRRAFSDPQAYTSKINSIELKTDDVPTKSSDKDDTRYDEIDQIYDYVRGFAPPPKLQTTLSSNDDYVIDETVNVPVSSEQDPPKPDPPPIETIPARRYPDLLLPVSGSPNGIVALPILIPPASLVKRAAENIYERIPRKISDQAKKNQNNNNNNNNNNSSSTRYYVHSRSGKNKIYIKGSLNSNNTSNLNTNNNNNNSNNNINNRVSGQRCRLFRQNKNGGNNVSAVRTPNGIKSSSSSTASPIFNIRYKSLTNLQVVHKDFNNTLDSSNSGGGTSGSYIYEDDVIAAKSSSKSTKPSSRRSSTATATAMAMLAATKLPRPKSMSNLVKDLNHMDRVHNRVNILNSAFNNCSNDVTNTTTTTTTGTSNTAATTITNPIVNKSNINNDDGLVGSSSLTTSVPITSNVRTKRIGTLYL